MAQIKNYACDMCNNNKLREPDGIDKFLIGLSAEDEEDKHKLVLENVDATCQFLVWLGHTIAKTEKDDSNVDGKSVDPHVDFALELMLYLSRVGCELDGLQQAYHRVLLHKSNHHILFHFNRTLYKGCASMKHLAILVNLTRSKTVVDGIVSSILPLLPSFMLTILRQAKLGLEHADLVVSYILNLTHNDHIHTQMIEDSFFLATLFQIYELQSSEANTISNSCLNIIRNITLDEQKHASLITLDNMDLIINLVYPLAGGDVFKEDEKEQLPERLRNLDENKKRDPKAENRKIILESLLQLCSIRHGRLVMRASNVYFVLRQYFNWEMVPALKALCEDLIQLIIKKEEEIRIDDGQEIDNLKDIHIPDHVQDKLESMKSQETDDALS